MQRERQRHTPRVFVLIAVLGMAILGGGVYFGVNLAVERAVIADAEDKAQHWADYFLRTMPGLEQLLAEGRLDGQQLQVIRAAEELGDVFRFKLFDLAGDVVLVSDEAAYATEAAGSRDHSEAAAAVLHSGRSEITVKDGAGKQNRPPLYVEAYVPIAEPGGPARGVVEVYLDQTDTAANLRTTFAALTLGLAVVAALAFGLPAFAFLFRSRQASEAKQRVEFLAHHDAMTGLLNRGTFGERLQAALQRPGAGSVAVAFIDVDDFKAINDRFGHEAGDEFLKHVARCLASLAGAADLVARPGGDEFTVALAGRSEDEAIHYVEAVMQAVRQPISIRGKAIAGRLSVGIHVAAPNTPLADAIHKADVALYQAKIDGRNTYRVFSEEMEARMRARRALEQRLRDAVASRSFELHFQPLLHADNKSCAGFEALLRLPDGQGGLIAPAEFIPVAESMGLINEIGGWVLEEATRIAASWPPELFVAVNLSVRQFGDGRLVDQVRRALERSGLQPRQLELEVTESMLVENAEQVGAQLKALQAMGVSVAMDDFGTGYSSLGYLWQFGFNKLKIDRSFVAALDSNDHRAREIVDTIIMLGHKLDMTVTAEGIESDFHARVLSELACDHFQGYLYGRPTPATELAGFILQHRPEPHRQETPAALSA